MIGKQLLTMHPSPPPLRAAPQLLPLVLSGFGPAVAVLARALCERCCPRPAAAVAVEATGSAGSGGLEVQLQPAPSALLCGPAGAGKTSVVARLLAEHVPVRLRMHVV